MSIDASWGLTHLHRNEIFSAMLKEQLRDELFMSNWINWMGEFTDGANLKINSIGDLTMDQMTEQVSLPDRRPDTGQFVLNINEFVGTKVSLTDVFFEDNFMANQTLSVIPERMRRAFDQYLETRVAALQAEQTLNDSNVINTAAHRFVGSGASDELIVNDIAYARYALQKAGVPLTNLVGIVDPTTAFNINVGSTVTTSDNPMWRGIIETGMSDGMRFVRNIHGFDLYESNYLDALTADEANLTDYSGAAPATADITGFKANMFFSAGQAMDLPFIGAWRRAPKIDSWRDDDLETEYHRFSARFGLNLYRPENFVVCLSNAVLN